MSLLRLGALAFVLGLPRLSCLGANDESAAGQPAPSSSVIQIAAGIGFCDDVKLCETECDAGSSDRCRRLGVNYEFGHAVEVDGAHATSLYEKACGMKNPEACVATGRMYEFHHGVAKDDAKAVSFYTRACDMGDGTGCANLAIMLENGRGIAKDVTKARALYTTACTQGSSLACAHARGLGDGGAAR